MTEQLLSLSPDQVLSDLIQVIQSPALLNAGQFPVVSDFEWNQWLIRDPGLVDRLKSNLQQITVALNSRPRIYKVGIYMEALLEVILREHLQASVLASNLVLYRGTSALGEMDFLWRDRENGQDYHWECALTFFLCQKPISSTVTAYDFIGPAGHDNLGKKMERVFDRQLKIKNLPEAQAEFQRLGICPDRLISQSFHRGQLFFHDSESPHSCVEVAFLADQAPIGWWLKFQDWNIWRERRGSQRRYVPLRRIQWFSKILAHSTLSSDELYLFLHKHFQNEVTGVMVGELENGIEVGRGFFVHSEWPKPLGEDRI